MERLDRGPKKRRRMLRIVGTSAAALTIVGLTAGGIGALHARAAADRTVTPTPPLPVAVMTVEMASGYQVEDRFAGRLEPPRQTSLGFERSGLLVEVLVDEGDRIARGAVVARMDVEPLQVERHRLQATRAQRSAERELSQLTEARQQELSEKGHSSIQRYDEARLNTVALDAAIVQIDARIAAIDIDLEKSEIVAPFAGLVAERFVDEGRVLEAGAPVINLMEADRAEVRIGLSPAAAAELTPGTRLDVFAGTQRIEATLKALRPDLRTGTRTVPALLTLDRPPALPFGEVVQLVVPRFVSASGTWLPITAVSEGPKGLWVATKVIDGPDGPMTARAAVEALHVDGSQVFASGTLTDGDRVVTGGHNRLVPGQHVALSAE